MTESSSSYEIAALPQVARNGNGKEFKPYYIAHTKIQTLVLLDDKYKGSNWVQWRTRLQPIRTAAEMSAQIEISPVRRVYMYQKYSQKAKELRLLCMSYEQIAKNLNVSKKTAINACKYEKVVTKVIKTLDWGRSHFSHKSPILIENMIIYYK